MISSKLPLNLSLNKGSEDDVYFASHVVSKSVLLKNYTVHAFTIGGQNYWSFSGCHESLDGCEETDIVIKYDINL